MKNNTLADVRELWEEGLTPIHVVTFNADDYPVVLVLLEDNDGRPNRFDLHRYFRMTYSWEVSVDHRDAPLLTCLAAITERFQEIYPKEN